MGKSLSSNDNDMDVNPKIARGHLPSPHSLQVWLWESHLGPGQGKVLGAQIFPPSQGGF